jgi:hypothetical protein
MKLNLFKIGFKKWFMEKKRYWNLIISLMFKELIGDLCGNGPPWAAFAVHKAIKKRVSSKIWFIYAKSFQILFVLSIKHMAMP